MIKIKIADIAQKKGLTKAYGLQKALNCSPTMANRLWKGQFRQIGIDTIDKLCNLFDCDPSDLIAYTSNKPRAEKPVTEPQKTIESVVETDDELMTTKQVGDELGLKPRTIIDLIKSKKLRATKGKQGHNFVKRSDFEEFKKKRSVSQ